MARTNYTIGIFDLPMKVLPVFSWDRKKEEILALKTDNLKKVKHENIITDFRHSSKKSHNYSKKLEEIFYDELQLIYREFNLKDYFIRNSWMEVAEKTMNHAVHNHGAIGFSAVVFVDFDPKVHTPTQFISPYGDWETGTTKTFVPRGIEEGSLLVFPSMLNHYTDPNNSDIPRTILSFNINRKAESMYPSEYES